MVLLGHSMGSLYITSMAEKHPERVSGQNDEGGNPLDSKRISELVRLAMESIDAIVLVI